MTAEERRGKSPAQPPRAEITDARESTSQELDGRVMRYTITMAFRTVCFLAMIWVPSPWRWLLFVGAVFLPYVAVIFANQANSKSSKSIIVPGGPIDLPQLTAGSIAVPPGEMIVGEVIPDDVLSDETANQQSSPLQSHTQQNYRRRRRVA